MSTAGQLTLYGYWRSSAAYRVRLALAWKQRAYVTIPINLLHGEQSGPEFTVQNPQGLVPLLIDGEAALTQSLAIIEYLEEVYPEPRLLPADPVGRARVRAAAQLIACDIHPLNNLRVLRYLKNPLGHPQADIDNWARHWITSGLTAMEAFAAQYSYGFLHGDSLSIADLCLVPQLYNARRLATDLSAFPRLCAIDQRIAADAVFSTAHPDAQMNPA